MRKKTPRGKRSLWPAAEQPALKRGGRKPAVQRAMARSKGAFLKKGSSKISEDDIVGFVLTHDGAATLQDILGGFGLGRNFRKGLHLMLEGMVEQRLLSYDDEQGFVVTKGNDYVEGVLSVNPRGFGFAVLDREGEDLFVAGPNMGSAMHGDRVLLRLVSQRGKKSEGRVVRVLARGASQIVGIYKAGNPVGMVTPEDARLPFSLLVRREQSCGARDGEAVVARIIEHRPGANPKGEIIEVLGDPDSLNVQTEIVIRKFELPYEFEAATKEQVRKIEAAVVVGDGRLDLRDIPHITIDSETARDFDDAVAVEKKGQGFRLYVSIADVSHYVPPGTPLDHDAYRRGTSVYFPTRVVPMLPERLSNDLCSLVPNEDRYAFTAILDCDDSGNVIKSQFGKSVIRSHYRMTYTKVWGILIDKDQQLRQEYAALLGSLQWMEQLARKFLARRMARGSIGFELPETLVEVGADDEVIGILRSERNFAHQIIEEFMLAANESVALAMSDKGLKKGLYRIHETPDPVKVAEFAQFAKTMGLELPDDCGTPRWFGAVIDRVKGTPQEYIVNNLLLRTMKQARYAADNVGHFGLAATHYCHFTSPIRRYPDLMVHRALAEVLTAKKAKVKKQAAGPDQGGSVHEAGDFLSKRERVAVDAEREMVDRLKVRYMEGKVGESFDGIISGVSAFGLFIELLDSFVSGAIAITDLKDDYYHLDERNHRLIGKRTNVIRQIGNLLRVKVASVEKSRRRINFVLAEETVTRPAKIFS